MPKRVSGWPRVEKTGVFGAGGGFIDWSNEVRSDAVWCPSNDRPFRDQPVSRRALFDELERTALQPLPSRPFELADWKSGKVNIDYHVEFDTRYHSVPHQLVHEPVDVRATAQVVEILHRNRRVTSHVREYGRRRFITKPEHSRTWRAPGVDAVQIGGVGRQHRTASRRADTTILTTRPHPEHGYRACMGLKRLVKRDGGDRVSAACQRALQINGASYTSVHSILKNDLDRVPVVIELPAKVVPIQHANLRGPAYYQQALALVEA